MSRTFHDLSPAERSAYQVYQSKLADRTLAAAEHDRIRREIDNLFWRGPNAQLQAVKDSMAKLEQRLSRIEFHLGLNDAPAILAEVPTPRPTAFPVSSVFHKHPQFAKLTEEFAKLAEDLPEYRGGQAPASTPPISDLTASASVPAVSDPFEIPLVAPNPLAQLIDGTAILPPLAAPATPVPTPDEKKPGRGRPKGAKNKAKAPAVASGEGREQPATEVKEGSVTVAHPSFTDSMMGWDDPENEWGDDPADATDGPRAQGVEDPLAKTFGPLTGGILRSE